MLKNYFEKTMISQKTKMSYYVKNVPDENNEFPNKHIHLIG